MTILVTGPTGNVGRYVVEALRARGQAVRAGVRRPAPTADADGVAEVALDLADPRTFAAAVSGCAAMFLLRPPAISDTKRTLIPLIDAARAAGVAQIVFLSVTGADTNPLVPHHAVERHLRRGAPGWTILRPGFFAQNFGDAYRRDLVEDDRLYLPAGAGRVAFVDVRDVAVIAADALVVPAAHAGRGYTLTGGERVAFAEAAELLTRTLGRPIRYVPASLVGYARHLRRRGLPPMQVLVQTVLHADLRRDRSRVDPTLGRLLGRAPRTLGSYFEDHAAQWRRS